MRNKFQIKKNVQQKEYFILTARNGEPILTSEEYESRGGLLNGIDSIRRNIFRKGAFKRKVAVDGQFYFVLRANNNKTIGVSETYKGRFGREVGILSVRVNAKRAKVHSTTGRIIE